MTEPGATSPVDSESDSDDSEPEEGPVNGLWNAQPYPLPPAAQLPVPSEGCARAQPLLKGDWERVNHGTGTCSDRKQRTSRLQLLCPHPCMLVEVLMGLPPPLPPRCAHLPRLLAGNGYTTVRGWWLPSGESAAGLGNGAKEAKAEACQATTAGPLPPASRAAGEGAPSQPSAAADDQEAVASLLMGIRGTAAPGKGPSGALPLPSPSFPLALPLTLPAGLG